MTTVDEHIQELREDGEAVPGQFTMDREKAREEMRRFLLADPHRFVLELVQAAVARGATRIDVEIDADDVHLRFDGQGFDRRELDEMYGSVFVGGSDALLRGRQQLALGLYAAMALEPRYVRVDSGDARMEMRPGEKDVIEARPADPGEARTHVHVRRRWRSGLVTAYVQQLRGTLPEVICLRERCRYSPVPVSVNGEVVSLGLTLEGAVVQATVEGPGLAGVAGFLPEDADPGHAGLLLLRDGVWIATHPWPDAEPRSFPFVAVVDDADLRKDVSQSEIVRDETYEHVRAVVGRAYLAALAGAAGVDAPAPWVEHRVRWALENYPRQVWKDLPFFPLLARAAWFEEARGGAARVRLETLLELLARDGAVSCATRVFPDLPPRPDGKPVCVMTELAQAAKLFDGRARCLDAELDEEQELRRAHARWRARPLAHLPEATDRRPPASLQAGGVRVELRIDQPEEPISRLYLVKEGCLLADRASRLPLGGAQVLLEAPFTPTSRFDGAVLDEACAEALLVLADHLPGLLVRLVDPARAAQEPGVRDYLSRSWCALATEDPGISVLRSLGFDDEPARQHAERWRSRPGAPVTDPALESLALVPLFGSWNAGTFSLAQIQGLVQDHGRIYLCSLAPANLRYVTRPLLQLDGYGRMLLEALLPEGTVRPYDAGEDETWLERMEKAEDWTDDPDAVWREPVSGPGLSGFVALPGPSTARERLPAQRDAVRVFLLKHDRVLGHHDFHSPAGPLVGRVRCDTLSANPRATGPLNDLELHRVGEAVQQAVLALVTEVCQRFADLVPDARTVVATHLRHAALDLQNLPGFDPEWLIAVEV